MATSELRLDPLSGISIIVAPHRQGRPRDRVRHAVPSRPQERLRHDPNCPFCPGGSRERATPILVLPDLEAGGWRARIVANASAAFRLP